MGREKREEENDGSSSWVPEGSAEDSLSDVQNGGDSKSDTYIADRCASMIFKCRGTNLTPSIRGTTIKNKSKRSTNLGNLSRQQIIQSRTLKQSLEGLPSIAALGLGQDESLSLVDQSDDSYVYCNFEDLGRISEALALLSRLKHNNWSHSSSKFLRNSRKN